MNNVVINKSLLIGFVDENGVQHRDFTLKLLTVKDEIDMNNWLLANHPDIDEKDSFEAYTIERAARLSFMLKKLGSYDEVSVDMLLSLSSDDFTLLISAEAELIKKYSEPSNLEKVGE